MRLVIASTWDGLPVEDASLVEFAREGEGGDLVVRVEGPYAGDAAPAGPPGRTDRLWEHEVVELFLAEEASRDARYLELELGPHGHWLALGFDGYRRRVCEDLALDFAARIDGERWSGIARVTGAEVARVVRRIGAVNAYAIRARRFLAAHPVASGLHAGPDFHRLEHFAPFRAPMGP